MTSQHLSRSLAAALTAAVLTTSVGAATQANAATRATAASANTSSQVRAHLRADVRNAATAAETFLVDHPTTKPDMAALKRRGFKAHRGDRVELRNGDRASDYCLRANNAADRLPGRRAVWYDSTAGGVHVGKRPSGRGSTCARVF